MIRKHGMGSHTKPGVGISQEWQTPPEILAALGPFDDDPCLPGKTDGLERPWRGLAWVNPPYNRDIGLWLSRLADHGNGIALIFARTETRAFFESAWKRADGILFLRGRLHFWQNGLRAKGNAGAPSCLVAYGSKAALRLAKNSHLGALLVDWRVETK